MGSGVEESTGIGMVCCSEHTSACLSLELGTLIGDNQNLLYNYKQSSTEAQQTNAMGAVIVC